MKLGSVHNFPLGTFRARLILGVVLFQSLMMTLLVIDLTGRQRALLLDRQQQEATALAQSLSTSAATWLAADDLAGLQELVEAQHRYPELVFAILADNRGRILAHTDRARHGQFLLDLPGATGPTVFSKTPALLDIAVPAELGSRQVGWARVGISQKAAQQKLAEIVLSGVLYAIAAIVIGAFITWWLGSRITRRLYAVQQTITKVRSGDRQARSTIGGGDEAAAIAGEFNSLLDALEERRAALESSENKYRLLLRNIGAAVVVHGPDTRIVMANPVAQELLGLSEEQLLGRAVLDPAWHFLREDGATLPPEEYPVNRVLAERGPLRHLTVGVSHPGREAITWVLVNGELILTPQGEIDEVIVTFVDISGRKQTEAALLASHETLRKREVELNEAQRLAHIGSWDWDAVRDTIWWSAEYYRIYGIDPSQTPPNYQEHLKAYTPESAARLDAAVQKSMSSGEPYEVDLELAQPTAATRWIVARCEVKKAGDGKIIGLRGTAQNITEQKLSEAKITALNEDLEKRVARRTEDLQSKSRELQESQLALMNIVEDLNEKTRELEQANLNLQSLDRLKSMFVASMSHELRTPLNSIIGFSSVILEEWLGPLNAEQKAKVAIVLRTGKHLLTLINDVIDVSKIEAGKLESRIEDFELGQVVAEALELVRKDGEEKGLRFRDATTPLTLHSDRRRFFQCLVNLLGNAVKFSTQGEVAVVSSLVPGAGGGPDCLRISVRDCGIGIPEADLPKLFTAFTRIQSELRDTVKGTGLGLYLVKKITNEILQGEVGVESSPGQGSIFSLTLPLRIEARNPVEKVAVGAASVANFSDSNIRD